MPVTDLQSQLSEIIEAAAAGRGVVSVAVLEAPGADPLAVWVPTTSPRPAFLAYSITKTFTASLVLLLHEEGRLSLEDPLAKWFPGITHALRISLRQLLNHTAGIPDYGSIPAYHESVRSSPSKPWAFERIAAETFEKGLLFEPGCGWAYSNPGYMLLRRIIEEVSGCSFRDLVTERIARPLRLQSTFVPESTADLVTLAPAQSRALAVDGALRDVRAFYHPGWVSHGVVASTPEDIVRFLDALFNERLLSPRSLEQMMQLVEIEVPTPSASGTQLRSESGKPGYGLGVMVNPSSPWGSIVGHNGGGPGYSASAFYARDLGGACVCVMGAIEEDFNAEDVVTAILDVLKKEHNI